MSEATAIWLIGGSYAFTMALAIGGIGAYILIVQRIKAVEVLISMLSVKAANILHSPHTPELDALLEKYYRTYNERHFELSHAEWKELLKLCQDIEDDSSEPKGTRLLAAIVGSVALHKLQMMPNRPGKQL